MTWIAYRILDNDPITIPFGSTEEITVDNKTVNVNRINTYKIANIALQFVGTRAEDLAGSIAFWLQRQTVKDQFATVGGILMADEMKVHTNDFFQDGNNKILSYNVRIRVLWLNKIQTTNEIAEGVDLEGGEVEI